MTFKDLGSVWRSFQATCGIKSAAITLKLRAENTHQCFHWWIISPCVCLCADGTDWDVNKHCYLCGFTLFRAEMQKDETLCANWSTKWKPGKFFFLIKLNEEVLNLPSAAVEWIRSHAWRSSGFGEAPPDHGRNQKSEIMESWAPWNRGGVASSPGRTVREIFIKSRTGWLQHQHQAEMRHRTTARLVHLLRVNVRNESAVRFKIHCLSLWSSGCVTAVLTLWKLNHWSEEQMSCWWAADEPLRPNSTPTKAWSRSRGKKITRQDWTGLPDWSAWTTAALTPPTVHSRLLTQEKKSK